MKQEGLERAKAAFGIEADALRETAANMDWESFSRAVSLLAAAPKIGSSGCGHTGIACMHFAHLMCCIGRPARFLSPSEALHGASGFLQPGDVLVVASRGGRTAELLAVIAVAKKIGVSVITVTENTDSEMAKTSDIVLPLRIPREVDRENTQGTSSFAATSAVFDALQAALIEETGHKSDQFAVVHPGGAVGERLNRKS